VYQTEAFTFGRSAAGKGWAAMTAASFFDSTHLIPSSACQRRKKTKDSLPYFFWPTLEAAATVKRRMGSGGTINRRKQQLQPFLLEQQL
jgi:hypothetical protein